jgi:dTDP-glucose pyrophosphorylase
MFLDKNSIKKIIILESSSIFEAINNLNKSQLKIVLIVDKKDFFVGIINDGDIRRAFLKGYNLNSQVKYILNKKPFIISKNSQLEKLPSRILDQFSSIPIIKNNKIQSLYVEDSESNPPLVTKSNHHHHIIIMAGGFGRRLGSLTQNCPKALLRYKNKPLLQHILENIKKNNFYNIYISIFFKKKMIKDFIKKNLFSFLKIKFLEEKKPLGTIGSLRLIKKISQNFIVMNCDVLTDINLSELMKFHEKKKSILTIATKNFEYKNPYGVVLSSKNKFISFKEKPKIDFVINAGIYVFNKKIISIMNKFDINNIEELTVFLKKKKFNVFTYQLFENWRDFGSDKNNLKKFI